MIKGTASRDMKLYLYSSVVFPFKGLNVEIPIVDTPLRDEKGGVWFLEVEREPYTERVNHNYQRDRQERIRNWMILLRSNTNYKGYPVAYYDKKRQTVTLYEYAFKKLKALQLLGKMYEAFDTNTPFARVVIDSDRKECMKLSRRTGVDINSLPF